MKATIASLDVMANGKTRFLHFLLMPVINIMWLMAIDIQAYSWDIASCSILMSGAFMAMSCFVSSFTRDRALGIDREMIAKDHVSLYFFGMKVLVCFLCSMVLVLINSLLLSIVSGLSIDLIRMLLLAPIAIFSGVVVGFVTAIASWKMKNPYFFSNIAETFGSLLGGVVVSLLYYPSWLSMICKLFPFSSTVAFMHGESVSWWKDLIIDVVWIVIGVIIYSIQIYRIRKQPQYSTL